MIKISSFITKLIRPKRHFVASVFYFAYIVSYARSMKVEKAENEDKGILYIVATPIGNLEDITLRALRILKEVSIIFAEDTRVTKKLLSHYEIHTTVHRLDSNVEMKKADTVLDYLEQGKSCALVSDAGTPNVSDPGGRLVCVVREAGFEVVAIPGASALTAALSISGVRSSEFVFLLFPPHKKGRKTFFENVANEDRTVVFYESSHRILKALESLGSQEVVVARELTKMFEEVLKGTANEVLQTLVENSKKQKGEFVVLVAPK